MRGVVTVRSVTKLILLVALGFACVQDATVDVLRVIDGDTIVVELGGRSERVRYIGIDTPEMNDKRDQVVARARAATEANRELVSGRTVRLEFDVQLRDKYGRLLAYVWVGDTLVNEVLVRQGYAELLTIPPNVKYADRLTAARRAAREGG
jgi:micrococcal nuclease